MKTNVAIEIALLVAFFATLSHAEFGITSQTTYSQAYPDVAAGKTGDFIAVWRSYRQDGDSGGIYCQRLDSTGKTIGNEYRINSTTNGDQTRPAVEAALDGCHVIVWQGPGPNEEDIFARLYDPNGKPTGDEFIVNSVTKGSQCYPKVAINSDGRFIVVWQSEIALEDSCDRTGSFQIYDARGLPVGQEVRFSNLMDCRYPDVAIDSKGAFVIVWMQDKPRNSIQVRSYDAVGSAQTDPCQVNTIDFGSVTRPCIAMSSNGRFAVTWDGHDRYASLDDIHARIFDPNANAVGEQFAVNTTQSGKQECPSIAITSQGRFVITWHSNTGYPGHKKDVCGQMFDSIGQVVGHEFCTHTYVTEDQKYPSIAITESDLFFCAWQSYKQDGSDYGIFGMLGPSTHPADFTGDGLANFRDFSLIASDWPKGSATGQTDLTSDGKIDSKDIAEFCDRWLYCQVP